MSTTYLGSCGIFVRMKFVEDYIFRTVGLWSLGISNIGFADHQIFAFRRDRFDVKDSFNFTF